MSTLAAALRALESALGPSKVCTEPARLEAARTDASEVLGPAPAAVLLPESGAQVARALALCSEHGVAVFPRGAGTGKTGGAVPTRPGVVLDTSSLRAVKELDRRNLLCVVEPGVVLGPLQSSLEAEGFFYPPDPNSLDKCTLGGNAAENAGGPRALRYGVTRDWVLGAQAATMDGTLHAVGKRTVKGVTGYDLTGLLVGSEGTLAVFTELTLRLLRLPPEVRTLLALYPSARAAGEAVVRVVCGGLQPRCLELLDGPCCAVMREQQPGILRPEVGSLLLCELDGEGPGLDAQAEKLGNLLTEGALSVELARDPEATARLWSLRRSMSLALRAAAKHKVSEDVVVPRDKIPALLEEVRRLQERSGFRMPAYGHAGDGNLHVNLLWDAEEVGAGLEAALEALFRATLALGGTLTGEHGIGLTKQRYLPLEQAEPLLALQRRLKAVFDPAGLLNPGKFLEGAGHRAC